MPERRDRLPIYEVTRRWLDAVASRASLFEPAGAVWTPETIDTLIRVIVDNPDFGPGGFQAKLNEQARSVGPDAQRLAAEAMFVFQLKDASALASTKRRQIDDLVEGLVPPVTVPDDLAIALDYGMARYGSGRIRSVPDYLFVLRFAKRWAELDPGTRQRLLDDPWAFRDLVDEVFDVGAVFARDATKHLVHPGTFEPIGSLNDKRRILRALGEVRPGRNTDLDRELESLRRRMERDGTAAEGFGFYDPEVRSAWSPEPGSSSDEETEDDASGPTSASQNLPTAPSPLRRAEVEKAVVDAGLRLPPGVVASLVAALNSGKHVVLTGAPGTAKTRLAQIVAGEAQKAGQCRGHVLATATADWSTFETVGGYRPQKDTSLAFEPGLFLEAIRDRRWLVLDEMNRANTDRALGPLFTVLSGQSVTLPAEQHGRPVRIRGADRSSAEIDESAGFTDYVVDPSWRIVATTNVLDRALLFDLSYALMRRFAFVEVACPPEDDYRELVRDTVADLDIGLRNRTEEIVGRLLPVLGLRPLGPALFMDAAGFVAAYLRDRPEAADREVLLSAFFAYLLPQFEGATLDEAATLLSTLAVAAGSAARREITVMLEQTLGVRFPVRPSVAGEPDDEHDDS